MEQKLSLLPQSEAETVIARLASLLKDNNIDVAIISDNANKFWLTGRVFAGWLTVSAEGKMHGFVRRPVGIEDENVTYVRKHEELAFESRPHRVGLEFSTLPLADFVRIEKHVKALHSQVEIVDISSIIRTARSVKTPYEIERISQSGKLHVEVNNAIPSLYRKGMTDLQLQIEIERLLRLKGCLGQFRISGDSMEIFMGNILAGDNADSPTPYDFAMGGAGISASLPVGADNTVIRDGMSVMVDANGNFTGWMTDMTRTFRLGQVSELAERAHQCSIEICRVCAEIGLPGVKASHLYEKGVEIAREAGLEDYFMGHRQKAGFIGHGIGIEVNEAPVIAPRSRDILAENNVIALEPKFVIPGTGAVGIENTYVVTPDGMRCLTPAPEEMLPL